MSNQPPPNWRRRHIVIQLLFGSTTKPIGAVEDILAVRVDEDALSYLLRLIFDYTELLPADLAPPTRAHRPGGITYFIPAIKPKDTSSLRQAEEQGLIIAAADGWTQHSRGAADNEGTGGIPREGYALAALNGRKIRDALNRLLREAIAYARRNPDLAKGRDPGNDTGQITIQLIASAVGGMGAGSHIWFLRECIAACARENGIEVKVVVDLLCRGNLPTHDTQLAQINELTTLKAHRAYASGAYVDAVTGQVMSVPFECSVRLFSNTNNHGNFTSLNELVCHQAHLNNFLARTPAGSDLREREPDIANWQYDEFEDPRCGYTGSVAALHWDRRRLLDCCAYRAAGVLIQSLLAEGDGERVLQEASAFAATCHLIESPDQNQLTAAVSRPPDLAGEPVSAQADQSFTSKVSHTRGLARAMLLVDTINSTRTNDVPSVFGSQMRAKAQVLVEDTERALAQRLEQLLRRSKGLSETIRFLQLVLVSLHRSQKAVTEKTNELQEYRAPHEQVCADATEQLQRLCEQNRLRRLANFPLLRRVTDALEQSGRAAIGYDLQIAACNIAIETVLIPLSDLLQRKLGRLASARQRFTELAQHCRNKAQARAQEPATLEVSNGLEFVTPPYVEKWFTEHIARNGGMESFIAGLQGRFIEQYGSLAALAEASFQEMEAVFTAVCRTPFTPAVENGTVLTELRRIFPEHSRPKLLAELIRRSHGRMLIEGEVNRAIAWVKTANVPRAEDTEWVAQLLEHAGGKDGKWQVAAHPEDPETFSIVQFRGDLSLTPFIHRLDLPDTYDTWKRPIPTAADPVSAIYVGPNPTPRQFRRVMAKAIASELLTIADGGCLVFHSSLGEQRPLGKGIETVHANLQPRWRQLVYTESYFASLLVDREAQIVTRLEHMGSELASQEPLDKRLGLIDATAIDECLHQIELLRPWTQKVQRARQRTSV